MEQTVERLNSLIESGEGVYLAAPYCRGHIELIQLFQAKRFFVDGDRLLAQYTVEMSAPGIMHPDNEMPTLAVGAFVVNPGSVVSLKPIY